MIQEPNNQPELDFQAPTIRETYGDRTLDSKMVDTSRDALDVLDAEMAETQKAVLAIIRQHPNGIGACQVAEAMEKSILSIRPCMTILKRKGIIFDTGRRRDIGKRSKEALMTSCKEKADPSLIGSGQLARTSEAKAEALLELKRWMHAEMERNSWAASPFTVRILDKIDLMVKEVGDE